MKANCIRYNNDQFQRLGLLKILVSILDAQRRSAAASTINRKLTQLLFGAGGDEHSYVEGLIRAGTSPSWNFPIKKSSIGLILDWGKLCGFVGSGNQITERGLILRRFIGDAAVSALNKGDFSHNPFRLTLEERIYFLYTQMEIDSSLYFLLRRLSEIPTESEITGIYADRLTCLALYDTYRLVSGRRLSSDILFVLKNLRELIGRMVMELDLTSEIPIRPTPKPRPTMPPKQRVEQRNKKRTKASDHEAIPRFELLTDLGLLEKGTQEQIGGDEERTRKAWRYRVAPLLKGFAQRLPGDLTSDCLWSNFAESAAILVGEGTKRLTIENDAASIAKHAYAGYTEVRRRFGHTPVESVGIVAMIKCLAASQILEVKKVHELFLSFKIKGLFSGTVRFAAGNDLDRMFIDIKPEFLEEVERYYGGNIGSRP